MAEEDPSGDSTTTISYRRNGKLFSCEPCRKGKLKCDHTTPVCGRCARRGKPDQCIYHPAPLTKPRINSPRHDSAFVKPAKPTRMLPYPAPPITATTTLQSTHGLVSPPIDVDRASVRQEVNGYTTYQVSDARTASSASTMITTPESCTSYRDSKHGFLGPTAFTSVFTENSESTGFEDLDAGIDTRPIPQEKIEQGADILAILRDMPLFRQFTKRWFDTYDGLVILQPVFKIWFEDLWNEWQHIFTQGTRSQLLKLSELVFRNTQKPVRTSRNTSAMEWSKAATGRNIRWEVVGHILSLVGLVAINLNEWDNIFDDMREEYIDRGTFAERMRRLSESCLCFCYECEVLNDMYVCFLFQDLILLECMKGDVHYAAWQRTGELLDTVVAMGLHQGNYVDNETPFWLSELRRKLFVASYSCDKTTASFLGRPPRLSYRYCKLEMPLDLNDDELFMEGAELEAALSMLDENGWNTSGRLSRRTWTRVWFQECLIREEILEIALGTGDEDLDDRVEKVRERLARVHQTFPASISMSVDQMLEGAGANSGDRVVRQMNALYVVCINSGLMLTEFLLQRAVVNRSKGNTKTLIPIARKLLGFVLQAMSRRDFFRDFRSDIIFALTSYGLPSAGLLAIELLKQEQSRHYEPDLLPKSETIQDLSVFIAALATVNPGEGNYNICNQGRRALKRVLDQVLATPAPAARESDQPSEDMSLYFPIANDAEFLEWLDNIDWDKNLVNTTTSAG